MYYILNDEKIVLFDTDKQRLENTIKFMPEYQEKEILETEKNIVELDEKFYFEDDEEYLNLKLEKEKARIAELSLTRADVFEGLILARGLSKQDLRAHIENDETLSPLEKTLYLNRFDDALEFYRKHPAIDFISTKLGISSENMDKFFDTTDYMYLQEDVSL